MVHPIHWCNVFPLCITVGWHQLILRHQPFLPGRPIVSSCSRIASSTSSAEATTATWTAGPKDRSTRLFRNNKNLPAPPHHRRCWPWPAASGRHSKAWRGVRAHRLIPGGRGGGRRQHEWAGSCAGACAARLQRQAGWRRCQGMLAPAARAGTSCPLLHACCASGSGLTRPTPTALRRSPPACSTRWPRRHPSNTLRSFVFYALCHLLTVAARNCAATWRSHRTLQFSGPPHWATLSRRCGQVACAGVGRW